MAVPTPVTRPSIAETIFPSHSVLRMVDRGSNQSSFALPSLANRKDNSPRTKRDMYRSETRFNKRDNRNSILAGTISKKFDYGSTDSKQLNHYIEEKAP